MGTVLGLYQSSDSDVSCTPCFLWYTIPPTLLLRRLQEFQQRIVATEADGFAIIGTVNLEAESERFLAFRALFVYETPEALRDESPRPYGNFLTWFAQSE